MFLDADVQANPAALDAIANADVVVLGPGDLYTSVVPNLLATGIPEAVRKTAAPVTYICNVMTKLGETSGYDAAHFAEVIASYLNVGVTGYRLDHAVVNIQSVPEDVQARYRVEGAEPVDPDGERLMEFTANVMREAVLNLGPPVRHDGDRLAELVMSLTEKVGS